LSQYIFTPYIKNDLKNYFFCTFTVDFGAARYFRNGAVKRESGVNPEQTRCCKLFKVFGHYSRHCFTWTGRTSGDKASQKTCQDQKLGVLWD